MEIGNFGANPDAWIGGAGTDLVLDDKMPLEFSSESAAVAYARSEEGSYAVLNEAGVFTVYRLDDKKYPLSGGLTLERIEAPEKGPQATNITMSSQGPAVSAIITRDDYVVQIKNCLLYTSDAADE